MFGQYGLPFKLAGERFCVTIEESGGFYRYLRKCRGKEEKKLIAADRSSELTVQPVEPVNSPKELTPYLQIHFRTPLLVPPRSAKNIFVTFPLEIALSIVDKKRSPKPEVIDIFSPAPEKFTLYGDPTSGLLCRYHASDTFTELPNVPPFSAGIMELSLENQSAEWMTVERTVFTAYSMKIYYSDALVGMKATVTIISDNLAETEFEDKPVVKGMKKADEIYRLKGLQLASGKFSMEWGL